MAFNCVSLVPGSHKNADARLSRKLNGFRRPQRVNFLSSTTVSANLAEMPADQSTDKGKGSKRSRTVALSRPIQ